MHRPPHPPDDAAIRATNDDAFASKLSASRVGYFDDPYLSALSQHLLRGGAPPRRPPVINRGTAARVFIKNALVDAFLTIHARAQVVSLGAGFDSLPFAVLARGGTCHVHYVEVDLEEVVREKVEAVLENEVLRGPFERVDESGDGMEGFARGGGKYSLRVCDLRKKDGLQRIFKDARLERQCPTLVLAEIVLVYLEWQVADRVVRECRQWFDGVSAFVNMEHVAPHDAFGKEMVRNIAARGSPLVGIERYPSVETQTERFCQLGWPRVKGMTLLGAFKAYVGGEQRLQMNAMELLDEVEEWELIMSHYCVVLAISGHDADMVLRDMSRRVFPLTNT